MSSSRSQRAVAAAGLHFCQRLTELHAGGNQLSSLGALSSLPDLRALDAGQNRLQDLRWLYACRQLERLEVQTFQSSLCASSAFCYSLADVDWLIWFKKSRTASLCFCLLTTIRQPSLRQRWFGVQVAGNQLTSLKCWLPSSLLQANLACNRLSELRGSDKSWPHPSCWRLRAGDSWRGKCHL